VSLLAVYALGLGVPFLIAALAAKPFIDWMRKFRRHVRKVEIAVGGLLWWWACCSSSAPSRR